MSSCERSGLLPPFCPAATQAAVEASTESFPADYVINIILEISGYLVSLVEQSTLFGRPAKDPYSPSLQTLHARLHSGRLNPSPIQSHANESARIKAALGQLTTGDASLRPLEDFEDLYYAVLAHMQDIHQVLNARLGSGFSTFIDTVYPDGPSIADLYVSLSQYWDVLNHNAFVKSIDSAVRRYRIRYLHEEIAIQVHNDEITHSDGEELLNDLYDPREYDGMQGLAWVSGWAPSMVAAWLEEKYRIVFKIEKEDLCSRSRMERKRSRMGKKAKQSQSELKSREEGKQAVDKMQAGGGEVKVVTPVVQQPQEKVATERDDPTDELLQYTREWQIKAQRVSEYSQYLRSMASRDARYLVEGTFPNNTLRMNESRDPAKYDDSEDMVF